MKKVFAASLVMLTSLAVRAEAELINYSFSGHVTGSSFSGHNVGDSVQGYLTYYNDLLGHEVYIDSTSYYATAYEPITISFTTGGETVTLTQGNSSAAESITNNYQYVLGTSVKGGPNQEDPFVNILFTRPGDYGSRALPPILNLSDYSGVQLGYFQGDSLFAQIDTLQAVPEPSTFILATAGSLGLTAFHLRRRMRKRLSTFVALTVP
jgi:hypothetical protein